MAIFSTDNYDLVRLIVNRIGNLVKGRPRVRVGENQARKILAAVKSTPTSANNEYILLNDTADLGHHQHLGCNVVTKLIHDKLSAAGLVHKVSINNIADINQPSFSLENVGLVIMNGEGSPHHDNNRILGLMEIAKLAKRANIPTALINSVWQYNSSVSANYLKFFDFVSVRERRSFEALKRFFPQARVIADMSVVAFSQKNNLAKKLAPTKTGFSFVVIDSMKPRLAGKLLKLAKSENVPMFFMGSKHCKMMRNPANAYELCGKNFPSKLDHAVDLAISENCLTGRYHGAVAALCQGLKVAAISSNTHKIEAMCEDIGIGDVVMLEKNWLAFGQARRRAMLDEKFASWNHSHAKKVDDYVKKAKCDIDLLFDDIAKAVAGR